MNNITDLKEIAIKLLETGFNIIPVKSGDKRPHECLGNSHNLFDKKAEKSQVQEWFQNYKIDSIGIINGITSQNLVTLDFDEVGFFENWYSTLSEPQKSLVNSFHKTKTRSGGEHLRFRTTNPQPTIKLAQQKIDGKSETIVEVRGDRSYALIPPTSGYTEVRGNIYKLPNIDDVDYFVLIETLKKFDQISDIEVAQNYNSRKIELGENIWDCLDKKITFEEMLTKFNWTHIRGNYWQRPGKKDVGVSATVGYKGLSLFYVFSSNAEPFEVGKAYTKFEVYTLLFCNGDKKLAIKELSNKYTEIASFLVIKKSKKSKLRTNNEINVIRWGDFKNTKFPTQMWWVKNLIPKNALVLLASPSGLGKSWISVELTNCLVNGKCFLGKDDFFTEKAKVLYLDGENPLRVIHKRGHQLELSDEILFAPLSDLSLNEEESIENLKKIIMGAKIDIVFIDTFRAFAGGLHEDKAEEVRTFYNRFKEVRDLQTTFVFLDHQKKTFGMDIKTPNKELILGSQDKSAGMDVVLMMTRNDNYISLYQTKNRFEEEIKPFKIKMEDIFDENQKKKTIFSYAGEIAKEQTKLEEAKDAVLLILPNSELSRVEIVERLEKEFDIGDKNANKALKILLAEKKIIKNKNGKKDFYTLAYEPFSTVLVGTE